MQNSVNSILRRTRAPRHGKVFKVLQNLSVDPFLCQSVETFIADLYDADGAAVLSLPKGGFSISSSALPWFDVQLNRIHAEGLRLCRSDTPATAPNLLDGGTLTATLSTRRWYFDRDTLAGAVVLALADLGLPAAFDTSPGGETVRFVVDDPLHGTVAVGGGAVRDVGPNTNLSISLCIGSDIAALRKLGSPPTLPVGTRIRRGPLMVSRPSIGAASPQHDPKAAPADRSGDATNDWIGGGVLAVPHGADHPALPTASVAGLLAERLQVADPKGTTQQMLCERLVARYGDAVGVEFPAGAVAMAGEAAGPAVELLDPAAVARVYDIVDMRQRYGSWAWRYGGGGEFMVDVMLRAVAPGDRGDAADDSQSIVVTGTVVGGVLESVALTPADPSMPAPPALREAAASATAAVSGRRFDPSDLAAAAAELAPGQHRLAAAAVNAIRESASGAV